MRSLLFAAFLSIGLALSGCGPSDEGNPSAGNDGGSKAASVPSAPTGEPPLKGDLEVAAFKGGYGIDFYENAAKEFQAKNPDLKINVWGNPRVWEQLRPRFVGGDPPSLTYPGWGMDHWALADEGQLFTLDEALDSPAYDGKTKWRDTFEPSILALGQSEGHQYVMPYFFNVMGWWYDPSVFAKHGWTPPKTYDELLALAPKIQAAGIAPVTFQGQYPYYMIFGMLMPWAYSVGGADVVRNAQNLQPGAWKDPAILKAAQMIDELNKKGFFEKGAVAMSHTIAQSEFLQGKAAMIPCGTWLYSESKNTMPAGAQMQYMLPPVVAGGKGDPTAVIVNIEPWMVPSKGKNPNAAVAFYKYLTSLPKAQQFVQQKATLMAIKGSNVNLPPVLTDAAKAFDSSKDVYSLMFREWYPTFEKEVEDGLTSMLTGQSTPEQFVDRCEKAAEKTRNDNTIKKRTLQVGGGFARAK